MFTMKFMTEEKTRRLETVLITLRQRSEAQAVFLTDRGGNILAEKKAHTYSQEDNIIALAAGSFFATRELARLLGEPEFKCVFHQGTCTSVYMQSTTSDLLMIVVYGKETNPGLVRLYANESCIAVDKQFNPEANAADASEPPPAIQFEMDTTKQLFKIQHEPASPTFGGT
jgi:predicted regulator of Ras-like GTPase activity (Roadblock/LC7/MglB family)